MNTVGGSTQNRKDILRIGINKHSILALTFALLFVVVATMVVSYQMTGAITLKGLAQAQANNFALRLLDLMPFIFAVWGQYTGILMARQADAIIDKETDAWRKKSIHDATHDPLTGLPNRDYFYKQLRNSLLLASRENRNLTVLFLNMDRFKEFNDAFGPRTGDYILKSLAEKMRNIVHKKDIVARISGDEFAFLLKDLQSELAVSSVVRRIHELLQVPVFIADENIEMTASIGVASSPEHGSDPDLLMQYSSIAMYSAKNNQKPYIIYSPELNQDNPRRVTLMGQLRGAIENDALDLHYQPKIDIRTGRLVAVEALARWRHPDFGYVSPAEFIPLAERTRLINSLTLWVIRKAIQQNSEWRRQGLAIGMSVNISSYDLVNSDLPDIFDELLRNRKLEPSSLTLEITETSIMDDPQNAIAILQRLNAMKLCLSIDDFGTGYSSLAYLSRLPVQELKIDQTFVMGMMYNKQDESIVRATIDLGHNLGLKVTAEGVENSHILEILKEMDCDIAQGHFISESLASSDFLDWVHQSGRSGDTGAKPAAISG